jgi:hypothetical protein
MGLAEKRAIKELQDKVYPELKQKLDQAAKFAVPLEVQWDTLASEGYAHLLVDSIPKVYFNPLIEALKSICADDMGQQALKGALKKVVIRNSGSSDISFADGQLLFDHDPVTNIDYGDERRDKIVKILEKAL